MSYIERQRIEYDLHVLRHQLYREYCVSLDQTNMLHRQYYLQTAIGRHHATGYQNQRRNNSSSLLYYSYLAFAG